MKPIKQQQTRLAKDGEHEYLIYNLFREDNCKFHKTTLTQF